MRQPLLSELSFCICFTQIFILYSVTVLFLSSSSVIADHVTESYLTENQYVADKISRVKGTWYFGNCRIIYKHTLAMNNKTLAHFLPFQIIVLQFFLKKKNTVPGHCNFYSITPIYLLQDLLSANINMYFPMTKRG